MKTFKDLQFKRHKNVTDSKAVAANMELGNGITVSVVAGEGLYSGDGTYEVAMFAGEHEFLPLSVWDDVLGWQTPGEINVLLEEAQTNGAKFMAKLLTERQEQQRSEAGAGYTARHPEDSD